jgi:hypothetical protein
VLACRADLLFLLAKTMSIRLELFICNPVCIRVLGCCKSTTSRWSSCLSACIDCKSITSRLQINFYTYAYGRGNLTLTKR